MTIQIDGLKDTIVGCSEFTIIDKSTSRIIVLPKPSAVSVPKNSEQRLIQGTDSLGRGTPIFSFEKRYNQQMILTFGQMLPELLELRLGSKFKTTTDKLTTFTRSVYVTGNTMTGTVDADTIGATVLEDQTGCAASVKDGNKSVVLTKGTFDTFINSATKTFAIGAGFDLKFSNDLIGKTVQIVCPYEVASAFELSGDQLPQYEINATFVDTANQVILFRVYDAKVSLEGASFDPEAEQLQIPFFLFPVAGKAQPYDLIYTNEKVLLT